MTDRDEKQDMLLQAARGVIAQYGFRKTTLEDIAEKAGIGKSTLYYYFDSKEKIFANVVERESALLLEAVEEAVRSKDRASDKLLTFVKTRHQYIAALSSLHNPSREVVIEVLPLVHEARVQYEESERNVVAGIITEGINRGEFRQCDVDLLAFAIIASLHGLTELSVFNSEAARLGEGLDTLVDLFLNGLNMR